MNTNKEIKFKGKIYSSGHFESEFTIPKGARVVPCNDGTGQFWLDDLTCIPGSLERHDADHYGVRINPADVAD